mgnify:CR=1 FL=1
MQNQSFKEIPPSFFLSNAHSAQTSNHIRPVSVSRKRIRIYVNIDIEGLNCCARLFVAELPEKTIFEL